MTSSLDLASPAITCGLIIGTFAECAKFSAVLGFVVLWFTFSYIPIAHMVWFWPGPDAYTDAAAGKAATAKAGWLAGCSRRVRSTSRAVPWPACFQPRVRVAGIFPWAPATASR